MVISGEMIGFSPHGPTGMEGWQDELLMQIFQDVRDACRQVVVEQNGAGIEAIEP